MTRSISDYLALAVWRYLKSKRILEVYFMDVCFDADAILVFVAKCLHGQHPASIQANVTITHFMACVVEIVPNLY